MQVFAIAAKEQFVWVLAIHWTPKQLQLTMADLKNCFRRSASLSIAMMSGPGFASVVRASSC